jgi:2,4-dienoyl-CoA reductase-like NADH-dependent reductase (Old Yellow Enzyme family)
MTQPMLISPLRLRGVVFANRATVAQMCLYSATGGFANTWNTVHLGTSAKGRAAR